MARHWQRPVVVTGFLLAMGALVAALPGAALAVAALATATLAFADIGNPGVQTRARLELAIAYPPWSPVRQPSAADLVTGVFRVVARTLFGVSTLPGPPLLSSGRSRVDQERRLGAVGPRC